MAMRQQFQQAPDEVDPFLAMVGDQPLPAAPALPFAGGDAGNTPPTQTDPFQVSSLLSPNTFGFDPNVITTNEEPGAGPPGTTTVPTDPNQGGGTFNPPNVTTNPPPGPTPPTGPTITIGGGGTPPGNTTPNPPAPTPTTPAPTGAYLQSLIASGMDPAAAIAQFNSQTGRTTGNQAVFYPAGSHGPGDLGTIGLPEGYLAKNPDGTWGWVARNPTDTGGGTKTTPPPSTTPPPKPGDPSTFPNVTDPGNVGQDPYSQLITNADASLIANRGLTPEMASVYSTLADIIGRSGVDPSNDPIVQQQMETARDTESQAFTGQLADTRDELANRGLLGVPGAPQGEEANALDRITRNIAPAYSSAVRDINTTALQRQNDRLTSALSTITGLSTDAAGNMLSALGQGTQRQTALAQIALNTLDENVKWKEFLANYGLSADQLMYQVQSGNSGTLLSLITLFTSLLGTTAPGYIPPNTATTNG